MKSRDNLGLEGDFDLGMAGEALLRRNQRQIQPVGAGDRGIRKPASRDRGGRQHRQQKKPFATS